MLRSSGVGTEGAADALDAGRSLFGVLEVSRCHTAAYC